MDDRLVIFDGQGFWLSDVISFYDDSWMELPVPIDGGRFSIVWGLTVATRRRVFAIPADHCGFKELKAAIKKYHESALH